MGLLDNISGTLKGVTELAESAAPGLISAALAKTGLGDMQGLVTQLQSGGLNTQVQSWLSSGSNMPVSADQLRAALGNDQVKAIAAHFGLPVDAALNLLAQHLPAAVDQASPNGTVQPGA
jgi:uncharacterized protein YidB (DUF937 family)